MWRRYQFELSINGEDFKVDYFEELPQKLSFVTKQYRTAVAVNALSKRCANFNVHPMRRIKKQTVESAVCV
jgi:hypothetical protein